MGKVIVVTSGKGGVGKTTTSAAFAAGLALRGHKTVVIDFDVGLRNLDLVMGCERRVVFDFINVINGDANLNQALIRDKRIESLYIFPTSQTRDKDALKREGVERVMDELQEGIRVHRLRQPRRDRAWRADRALPCRRRDHRHQPRSLLGARQRPHHRHSRLEIAPRREAREAGGGASAADALFARAGAQGRDAVGRRRPARSCRCRCSASSRNRRRC